MTPIASASWKLKSPGKRPEWLRVERLLGEYRIPQDSTAGRKGLAEGNCSGRFCGLRQERAAVESAAEVFEDGQAVLAES